MYAIMKGARNYNELAFIAAQKGYIDLIKILVQYIHRGYLNNIAFIAVQNKHSDIVRYLISAGARNYDDLAYMAALNGDLALVKYLYKVSNHTINMNKVACNGARNGHFDVVEYAFKKHADNFNDVASIAARNNFKNILELAINKGADNYESIYNTAMAFKNHSIAIYISYFKNDEVI